ncbi:hypothetical protein [Sphingobacterium sp. E70]|uniref:hypothetical protein n=1 Tax=Sphingobacterium sp. E70 TaxID=2853439 RepID=UPI00359C496D
MLTKSQTDDDFKVMASPLLTEELVIMPTATNGIKAFDRNALTENGVSRLKRPLFTALLIQLLIFTRKLQLSNPVSAMRLESCFSAEQTAIYMC